MQKLLTFWNLICSYRTAIVLVLIFSAAYFTSWNFRREIRLIHPMANLRYFYYGTDPDTISDKIFYWFYYPVYRPMLAMHNLRGGNLYEIHWSEGRDWILPTNEN